MSGGLHYFRTAKDLSEFTVNTWGTKPLSNELITRVAKQLSSADVKQHCPVYYKYAAIGIRRINLPEGADVEY